MIWQKKIPLILITGGVVEFMEKILTDLVGISDYLLKNLKAKVYILDRNFKYFTYMFEISISLGSLYPLPKVNPRLFGIVAGSETPLEKVSEILDYYNAQPMVLCKRFS